jgi:hypothetical protein
MAFTPGENGEIEQLAIIEHNRWNAERWLAGWMLGEKNIKKKISPYLVPWTSAGWASAASKKARVERSGSRSMTSRVFTLCLQRYVELDLHGLTSTKPSSAIEHLRT